jgi:hypothetical protein
MTNSVVPAKAGTHIVALIVSVALLVPALLADETPGTPPQPPVRVTTRVEPKSVTIGTPFRYTMRVETDGEVELLVPLLAERLGDFAIADFGEVPHGGENGKVIERWYDLVTYETGDRIVPGPAVHYREAGGALERIDAPDALVIVESLLAAKDGVEPDDVRDIKGPVAVPRDYRPLWWAVAALAVLAAIVFAAYRILNRSGRAATAAPRPAHELALEALARLRSARLIESGRHEEYYVRLSAIVREYLERRFQLRAPEMTTEEFLQAAQQNRQIATEHRASLGRFLGEADLVKFARYLPSVEDAERAYGAARRFVEATAPPPEVERAAA